MNFCLDFYNCNGAKEVILNRVFYNSMPQNMFSTILLLKKNLKLEEIIL